MNQVSQLDPRERMDHLLKSIPEDDLEGGDVIAKVEEIRNLIWKHSALKSDASLLDRVFNVINRLGDTAIQQQCRLLILQEAPAEPISVHELTEEKWMEVALKGNQTLVIKLEEGGEVVYEPRVLQQFLENPPPIKDLTDMYTLKFEDDKTRQVPKATLLLCGGYLKGMVQAGLKEAKAKTIDFRKQFEEFYDAFDDLLNEVKTGKREMEDDAYQVICEELLYTKWCPPIPEGAFGKEQWETHFPVTIEEVPPLPNNIHEILELKDPYEPGKTLRETCMLFLRPEKVTLHNEEGDRELILTFDGVEELMQKATNPERRVSYDTFPALRNQMNQMSVAKTGWVLMRKEVIPETRSQSFEEQKKLLKGNFEAPKMVDAILLNILTYVSEGKYLFGQKPRWTYTRCQEKCYNDQTILGGFAGSLLIVNYYDFGCDHYGLSAFWKF